MDEIKELFYLIEKRPGICVGDKKVDYLFHYLLGRFELKKNNNIHIFCTEFTQWIYDWIKDKGYDMVEFSFYWYKMIYTVTNDEEEAWKLFFQIVHEYFEQLPI